MFVESDTRTVLAYACRRAAATAQLARRCRVEHSHAAIPKLVVKHAKKLLRALLRSWRCVCCRPCIPQHCALASLPQAPYPSHRATMANKPALRAGSTRAVSLKGPLAVTEAGLASCGLRVPPAFRCVGIAQRAPTRGFSFVGPQILGPLTSSKHILADLDFKNFLTALVVFTFGTPCMAKCTRAAGCKLQLASPCPTKDKSFFSKKLTV